MSGERAAGRAAARSPLAGGPLLPLALKWRSRSRLARRIRGVLATLKLEPHLGREHAMAAGRVLCVDGWVSWACLLWCASVIRLGEGVWRCLGRPLVAAC